MSAADISGGAEPRLYESRKKIFPKDVKGPFRRFKWTMLIVTLSIYYLTPWIRWSRGAGAPDQAVLIDLSNAKFYFFFIEIWPQEFYYVAGLLIMAGLGLFLVTSIVGRAWCGYACPQTVWTDLFLWIERRLEGDRNAQKRLDKAPWTARKLRLRLTKHAAFVVVAVLTGGAWVFYFADAPTLAAELMTGAAATEAYAAIAVLTFTTYSLGGLMREQVCIYMCPWPRIQAAMTDERSLIVTYQDWRGEPRGAKRKKGAEGCGPLGDCLDCGACAAVCPMGIDIRDGQQLACITCGLCIDACDAVMDKVARDKGLIAYCTLEEYDAAKATGEPPSLGWRSILKLRSVLYLGLWSAIGVALVVALTLRDGLDATIRPDRNPQFVMLSDGSVRNGFQVKILNMRLEDRRFEIAIEQLPDATLRRVGGGAEEGRGSRSSLVVHTPPDEVLEMRVFIERPREAIQSAHTPFEFTVTEIGGRGEHGSFAAAFKAPARYEQR
ncbi:MAG: cytochrome c oxidase accessory protein CcoG [Pseudomonadota bacterium]